MGRRERKKLQSRKTILEAAISEFSKKGYKETSVADIMSTADLGIGTFYNYFNSKEDLLFSLLGRLGETIRMALAEARAAERTSLELLEVGARVTAKFLDENRFVMPLFLSAFRRADELALAMEARCYRGGEGRTQMKELRTGRLDYLAIVVFFVGAAGICALSLGGLGIAP